MTKITIKVKTSGVDYDSRVKPQLERLMASSAIYMEREVKQSILTQQTRYRPYPRGKKIHWSSAPGYPPNNDTGMLANSIKHTKNAPLSYTVSASTKYAIPLELGWRMKNGKHVPARPFMAPALVQTTPRIIAGLLRILG